MSRLTKVRLTNLQKILYPTIKASKKDVIAHYIHVAPQILPFLINRPLVVTRFPDGISAPGFYGKDAPRGRPDWVRTHPIRSPSTNRVVHYILCNDLDTLLWLANLAALEIHLPLAHIPTLDHPDFLFFDLDPEPPASITQVCDVALQLKELLTQFGLEAFVKTSGKKGLHILVPLHPNYTYQQTRTFVHQVGLHLAQSSDIIVADRAQTKEPGTILIDYPQNARGRTLICPYSLRGVRGGPVSTPLEWTELTRIPSNPTVLSFKSCTATPWQHFWDEYYKLPGV
jgi:bifunctional non-homologous end joining protein LigD